MKTDTTKKKGGRAERIMAAALVLCAAGMFWLAARAYAQVNGFGGGTPIQGTTNGPVVATLTNNVIVRPIAFTVSGGTNAASVFIGNVMASINGTTNGAFQVGSLTNAVGTGTFSSNLAAFTAQIPITLYLQAVTGTNTLNVTAIYGP